MRVTWRPRSSGLVLNYRSSDRVRTKKVGRHACCGMTWRLTVEPRTWQRTALEEWKQSFRGVASVVTGGGKTLFAEMCMLEFLREHPKARFIVVVPTTALLDQW